MAWYNTSITVPYANPNFDKAMGGPHDLDLAEPPNTPITALRSGTVVDISSPAWGEQVGIQMDNPLSPAVPYMAYLHLAAVNPALTKGEHINAGDLVGWSGGANSQAQYAGTSNPTGQNFVNSTYQSGQPQVGLALMYGPVYGSGQSWDQSSPPSAHPELNPLQLFQGAAFGGDTLAMNPLLTPTSNSGGGINIPFLGSISPDLLYRLGFGLAGLLLVLLAIKHFMETNNANIRSVPDKPV